MTINQKVFPVSVAFIMIILISLVGCRASTPLPVEQAPAQVTVTVTPQPEPVSRVEPTQAPAVTTAIEPEKAQTDNAAPKESDRNPNRLISEKSPYLLQHAYNPVDWYPWGPEAFKKARLENKPIFLSIGYSTCHWCHVMEAESFEDPEVARLMNETFVSIKVDREERPDLDNIYMNVSMMMTGGGGWPLNIIMTPDQKPFFAGTYIPKDTRFGRPGMLALIPQVRDVWLSDKSELLDVGEQVVAALQQIESFASSNNFAMDETILETAYQDFAGRFDAEKGGFGPAPKFPGPHNLLFLLRYWKRSGDEAALEMVETTLNAMRRGGIYDQVGFGFHRYATDADWLVPHFEKMLYDQAMLALVYTEAYQATGKTEYAQTAHQIFTYVLRDMTDPNGGFYSAEDADSEGEEGKFYLWTAAEIGELLPREDAEWIINIFNVTPEGNFMGPVAGDTTGENILHLAGPVPKEAVQRLDSVRQQLFSRRETRVHPHKDDKILTDWNGLMIAALAKGGRVFAEPAYTTAAENAANFILSRMRDENGRLLHRYRDGEAGLSASVDDYAFFTWGLLELYETTFNVDYLDSALTLTDDLLTHYWDKQKGGFYFTPDDGETLLVRQKQSFDNAIPSGNSVEMMNLLRLARITANTTFEEQAVKIGNAFASNILQQPSSHAQLLSGVDFGVGPSHEVVIVGEPDGEDTRAMLNALSAKFVPNKVALLRTPGKAPDIVRLAEYTRYYAMLNNQATAYVCLNYYCELPTNDINKMLELLDTDAGLP